MPESVPYLALVIGAFALFAMVLAYGSAAAPDRARLPRAR